MTFFKRRTFITALLVTWLSHCDLIAQKLTPGYIVDLEHDTTSGFIVDRTDAELNLKIEFTTKKNSTDIKKYSPADLLGFGFDYGRIFERFLINGNNKGTAGVALFAKKYIEGKVTLYTIDKAKSKLPEMILVNNYSRRNVHLVSPKNYVIMNDDGTKRSSESTRYIGLLAFVKGDSINSYQQTTKIAYREKAIKNDILKYNSLYKSDFPVSEYKSRIIYSHDMVAGMPIINSPEGSSFRIAYYRNRNSPERSRSVSHIQGVSYRYWADNSAVDSNAKNSNVNFRQQFLSVIPFGLNFHGASKVVRPYFYFGAGLGLLVSESHHIIDSKVAEDDTDFIILPAINVGGGLRIKIGSKFILVEVTPTSNYAGVFGNIGFSF